MQTWEFIADKFRENKKVILLYVLQSIGSSPGRQGFKMAVSEDLEMHGTIGGGIMEHKFVELARSLFKSEASQSGVFLQVHDKDSSNRSGMICSGEQTLFIHPVNAMDIGHINDLAASLKEGKNGKLTLTQEGISFSNEIPGQDFYFEQFSEAKFILQEKTGFKNILHVIGGGHCSLAFCRIMSRMDFQVNVYEERVGLNTFENNSFANNKYLVEFKDLGSCVHEGPNVYVVIMTFGYRTDDIALRSLAGKKFRYIGLLGSRNKVKKMFDQYATENINSEWLNTIHSPVGINIKSETAEEIAVSIAAEIISVKNNQ